MTIVLKIARAPGTSGSKTRDARLLVSSDFDTFAGLWPRAAEPGDALFHVFQSAEFLQVWLDTIGQARGITPCFCAVLDSDGAPLMLLPLGIERRWGVRTLAFLDAGVSDYNAPVLFRETPDWDARQSCAILQEIFAALPAFDVALFEKMPADVLGRPNPLLHLGARAWPCEGHAAATAKSWAEFSSSRIKHSKRFARYHRQLQKTGPVAYVVADLESCEPCLEKLFAQKQARFIETRVPGFSEQPGMQDFYREATKRFLGAGLVHLSTVVAGQQTIAAQWGLRQGDRYYYLICGYEGGEWEKFSPGRLVTEAMLKWCHENGVGVADFGIGDEVYKYEYCDKHLKLYSAVKPVTLRGRAHAAGLPALAWLRNLQVWQKLRPYKWVVLRHLKRAQSNDAHSSD